MLCRLDTIHSKIGNAPAIKFSHVLMLYSRTCSNKPVICSDFVVSMDSDGTIKYDRMLSEGGIAEGSVSVYKSKIPVALGHGKA